MLVRGGQAPRGTHPLGLSRKEAHASRCLQDDIGAYVSCLRRQQTPELLKLHEAMRSHLS